MVIIYHHPNYSLHAFIACLQSVDDNQVFLSKQVLKGIVHTLDKYHTVVRQIYNQF